MRSIVYQLIFITCAALLAGACDSINVRDPKIINVVPIEPQFAPSRSLSIIFVVDVSQSMNSDTDIVYVTQALIQASWMLSSAYDDAALIYYYDNLQIESEFTDDFDALRSKLTQWPKQYLDSKLYPALLKAYQMSMENTAKSYRQIVLITDEGNDKSDTTDISNWATYLDLIRPDIKRPFLTVVDLNRNNFNPSVYDIMKNEFSDGQGNFDGRFELLNANPVKGMLPVIFRNIILANRERQ